jgi:hypothetical protein
MNALLDRTRAAALVLVLVLASAAHGAAAAQQPGPAAVVATLYRDHFARKQEWKETYRRHRALFAPALAALIDADQRATANADEIVGLDFDPLTAAQDVMERFEVGAAHVDRAEADVPVTIGVEESRYVVHVKMARSPAGWRITDIRYPAEQGDLVGILRQLATDRARKQ